MARFQPRTTIDLAPRANLPLHDARGLLLRVTRGTLWITQENDTRDVVLRAGDTWVVERDGLTIVEAQAASTLCVGGRKAAAVLGLPSDARAASTVRWTWLRRALSKMLASAQSRRFVPYY